MTAVSSVLPAAASTTGSSSTAINHAEIASNFTQFLQLLTTQLKNQDPMSPLDTNQFTQQLVSFSQVEQAIKTNDKLTSLVSLLTATQVVDSLPLVGKSVEVDSASTGLQNGKASFSYTLPA